MKSPNIDTSQLPLDHFFRGAFSIDIVLLTYHDKSLKVLLQKKKDLPDQSEWGLPGKLLLPNEETDAAMDELILAMIGTSDFYKKQLQAFSDLDRHPLGRVITFAYYGLIAFERLPEALREDLRLIDLEDAKGLSYDHDKILKNVLNKFRKGLMRHPTVFELLAEEFILSDLIGIYNLAFGTKYDNSNFRRRLKKSKFIQPLGKFYDPPGFIGRPAELHRFNREEFEGMVREPVPFDFYFRDQ